jgi:hypothetical protein
MPKGSNVENKINVLKEKNLLVTDIKLLSKTQRNSISQCNFKTIITPIRGRPLWLPAPKAPPPKKKATSLFPTLDAEPSWLCKEKQTGPQTNGM